MARPPLPHAIQDAKGAYLANPARENQNEPQPEGDLPIEPPAHLKLTPKLRAIWVEVVTTLAPGVGKSSDILGVESLVRLKAKERSGRITGAERGQLIALYGRFALTPSDRCKVSVEKKPKTGLGAFLSKRPDAPLPQAANTLPA